MPSLLSQGSIYRFGGEDGTRALQTSLAYDLTRFTTSLSSSSDKGVGEWQRLAPMPTARGFAGAARLGDMVYVCGGFDKVPLADVERYSIKNNTWRTFTSMEVARSRHVVLSCAGFVYMLGGETQQETTAACEVYDPRAGVWRDIAPMLVARRNHAGVCFNSRLYVFGGDSSGSVECYSPSDNEWKALAPLPAPTSGARAVALNGTCILVVGTSDAYMYHIDTNTWSRTSFELPATISGFSLHDLDGLLVVAGGRGAGEFSSGTEGEQANLREARRKTYMLNYRGWGGSWRQLPDLPEASNAAACV